MRTIVLLLAGMACVSVPCAASQVQAARDGKTAEVWVKAGITISPEGRITALQWQGKPKPALIAVRAAVEPKIRSLELEPGRLDGVATETETTLSLKLLVHERSDKGWDIWITDASTGATALEIGPPRYPASQLRAGTEAEVVNEIAVDGDGRVTLLDATYRGSGRSDSSRKAFLNASADAVKDWTYRLERVGGRPVAARMSVPVSFCLAPSKRPWCDGLDGKTRSANGREVPAGEAVALDSVVKLKTDLTTPDI